MWRGLERVTVLPKAERRSIRSGGMQRSAQWLYQNPEVWSSEKKEFIGAPRAELILAPGLAAYLRKRAMSSSLNRLEEFS